MDGNAMAHLAMNVHDVAISAIFFMACRPQLSFPFIA